MGRKQKPLPEGLKEDARTFLASTGKSNRSRILKNIEKSGLDAWKPKSRAPHNPRKTPSNLRQDVIRAWEENPGLSYDCLWGLLQKNGPTISRTSVRNVLKRNFASENHDPTTAIGSAIIFESHLQKGLVEMAPSMDAVYEFNPRLKFFGAEHVPIPGKELTVLVKSYKMENPWGPNRHYHLFLLMDVISGFIIGGVAMGYNNFRFLHMYFDLCRLTTEGPCFRFFHDTRIRRSKNPDLDPIGGAVFREAQGILSMYRVDPEYGLCKEGVNSIQNLLDAHNNCPISMFPNNGKTPLECLLNHGQVLETDDYITHLKAAMLPLDLGHVPGLNRGQEIVLGEKIKNVVRYNPALL